MALASVFYNTPALMTGQFAKSISASSKTVMVVFSRMPGA